MRLKFFFTQTAHEDQCWGSDGAGWSAQMKAQVLASGTTRHLLTDDPDEADVILFWEPHQDSQVIWAPRIRAHPLVHQYPNKSFVVWLDDAPLGFLPGLYTSLPARLFDRTRHRAWIYWRLQNPFVLQAKEPREQPRFLASFHGGYSHHVRRWLFDRAPQFERHNIRVIRTEHRRFAPNPHDPALADDQRHYVEMIQASKFSLCPRGNGTGTFRVQESMCLGRAPVIISEEWVPVEGPDWNSFAIFLHSENLDQLPAILRTYEHAWEAMGRNARTAWERWFRPRDYALHALDLITNIYTHRTHDERTHFARWNQMIAAERHLRGLA